MKLINRIPILGRLIKEDKGQALVFTAVVLTAFVGVTGVTVDAGKGYYAFQMLKASTDAAALAGAAGMPNTTTATTYADDFGSETSAENANGVMNSVTESVGFECLTSVTDDFYAPCENAQGTGTGTVYNAIQVSQTAKVPTWIGPLFGMNTFNIADTATASMKGGTPTPYNIAIVLDTTESMNGADDGKNNGVNGTNCSSQIACAELGIQIFLQGLVPGTASSPIDLVSLYVFPAATSLTISKDYACSSTNPTIVPYTFQSRATTTLPAGDTYNVIAWDYDYKSGNSSSLNTSDDLVLAVGGKSGCGAKAPGGEGTYYAQVIYQAQADLATEQAKNHNANMMIILSDGDATASNPQTSTGSTGSAYQIVDATCPQITTANGAITSAAPCVSPYSLQPIKGTDYSYTTTGTNGHQTTTNIQPANYLSPDYPSALGECGQAVIAAQAASAAGTKVYTIGYAAEMTGCTTDSTYTDSGSSTYGANAWPNSSPASGATSTAPCYALGAMATQPSYFFADGYSASGTGCQSTDTKNKDITSLNSIFQQIGANITSARLIPNNAT
jgi:Flp pilus assembly protein TadG